MACLVHLLSLLFVCPQVQRRVQVPTECTAGAVAAAALLGSTDAEETPQVQPDRRCEMEATQPHGLPDRQPAVLLTGNNTVTWWFHLGDSWMIIH